MSANKYGIISLAGRVHRQHQVAFFHPWSPPHSTPRKPWKPEQPKVYARKTQKTPENPNNPKSTSGKPGLFGFSGVFCVFPGFVGFSGLWSFPGCSGFPEFSGFFWFSGIKEGWWPKIIFSDSNLPTTNYTEDILLNETRYVNSHVWGGQLLN